MMKANLYSNKMAMPFHFHMKTQSWVTFPVAGQGHLKSFSQLTAIFMNNHQCWGSCFAKLIV